jgi:hypothetical protein
MAGDDGSPFGSGRATCARRCLFRQAPTAWSRRPAWFKRLGRRALEADANMAGPVLASKVACRCFAVFGALSQIPSVPTSRPVANDRIGWLTIAFRLDRDRCPLQLMLRGLGGRRRREPMPRSEQEIAELARCVKPLHSRCAKPLHSRCANWSTLAQRVQGLARSERSMRPPSTP